MLSVTTASGRVYHIDTEGKTFYTEGDQKLSDGFGHEYESDYHHEVTQYHSLGVDDMGRIVIVEPDGGWRVSTRVVVGLDDLLAALDA